MSGHDELVLIPEEEIDTSDLSENESDVQNTETINDQSVEMVGFFLFFSVLRFRVKNKVGHKWDMNFSRPIRERALNTNLMVLLRF